MISLMALLNRTWISPLICPQSISSVCGPARNHCYSGQQSRPQVQGQDGHDEVGRLCRSTTTSKSGRKLLSVTREELLLFVLRVEFTGQLTRQHILIHHCLELCFHQLCCLHGSEDRRNVAMHFRRRRLTARCVGNDYFLNELADDADKRGLMYVSIQSCLKHSKCDD